MSNKTIKVRITNEELFALGFERVIYNGKEYVDKSPLFLLYRKVRLWLLSKRKIAHIKVGRANR